MTAESPLRRKLFGLRESFSKGSAPYRESAPTTLLYLVERTHALLTDSLHSTAFFFYYYYFSSVSLSLSLFTVCPRLDILIISLIWKKWGNNLDKTFCHIGSLLLGLLLFTCSVRLNNFFRILLDGKSTHSEISLLLKGKRENSAGAVALRPTSISICKPIFWLEEDIEVEELQVNEK